MATKFAKPRLILHFDINKTIVMLDPVGGKTLDDMINSLLSECAWGKVSAMKWTPTSPAIPSFTPPDEGLRSYGEFVEDILHRSEGTLEERKQAKEKRRILKASFTAQGAPGEMYRDHFHRLRRCLSLPHSCLDAMKSVLHTAEAGTYFLIPAFFTVLNALVAAKRDFRVVFRTFGTDLDDVIEEMNLFCEGKHPAYPEARADGTNHTPDLRFLSPLQKGTFFRKAESPDDTYLLFNTVDLDALQRAVKVSDSNPAPCCPDKPVPVHQSIQGVYDGLLSSLSQYQSLALRDCFAWWFANGESDDSGKVLLLDPSAADDHHIFFDDNVERNRLHIIDPRNVRTGEPLPYKDVINVHVVRSNPYEAITNPNYFVNEIAKCEEAFQSRTQLGL
eukprot:Rmarinus@m.22297